MFEYLCQFDLLLHYVLASLLSPAQPELKPQFQACHSNALNKVNNDGLQTDKKSEGKQPDKDPPTDVLDVIVILLQVGHHEVHHKEDRGEDLRDELLMVI